MVTNVCFFNSVVQILYSLPSFRSYILQISNINEVTTLMRNIFQEISARESVRTSYYVRNIGLCDYSCLPEGSINSVPSVRTSGCCVSTEFLDTHIVAVSYEIESICPSVCLSMLK